MPGHHFLALTLTLFVILPSAPALGIAAVEKVSVVDIWECLESLDKEPADPSVTKERARELGAVLFKDAVKRDRFADEVTDLYLATRDADFLLVYNTGGFGAATMADDLEWPGVLEGIKRELAELGYQSMIVEYVRGEGGFLGGFIDELRDLRHNYRRKARELTAKISFLTRYNPQLKVILTGRCFGGMICNEVMKLNGEDSRLYSIQASIPFWYTEPVGQGSLVLPDNGVMPDIVRRGGVARFLWTLFKASWGRLPSVAPPEEGSFRAVCRYLKAPGHTYTWNHPGVRSYVVAFLRENFGR